MYRCRGIVPYSGDDSSSALCYNNPFRYEFLRNHFLPTSFVRIVNLLFVTFVPLAIMESELQWTRNNDLDNAYGLVAGPSTWPTELPQTPTNFFELGRRVFRSMSDSWSRSRPGRLGVLSPTVVAVLIRGERICCATSLRTMTEGQRCPLQLHHHRLASAIKTITQALGCGHCNSEGCAELAVLDFAAKLDGSLSPPPNEQPIEVIFAIRLGSDERQPVCIPPCGTPRRGGVASRRSRCWGSCIWKGSKMMMMPPLPFAFYTSPVSSPPKCG